MFVNFFGKLLGKHSVQIAQAGQITGKFNNHLKDIIRVKNHLNLIVASNSEWVVPAGLEERRFFVLDASDKRMQDHSYFSDIVIQMENDGLEAMFHDLLNLDISGINLREFEQTAAL